MKKLIMATAAVAVLATAQVHADDQSGNPTASADAGSSMGCAPNTAPCASMCAPCNPDATVGCNPCGTLCSPCNPCASANPCAAGSCNPCQPD
jgi:hypothetical protein